MVACRVSADTMWALPAYYNTHWLLTDCVGASGLELVVVGYWDDNTQRSQPSQAEAFNPSD